MPAQENNFIKMRNQAVQASGGYSLSYFIGKTLLHFSVKIMTFLRNKTKKSHKIE